ncbi:MAG: hypothetical protein GY851_18430 [bacterium]|nr:hypothetical protein [bacterium]
MVPSTAQWTNPGNAAASDDARASLSFVDNEFSYKLRVSDFGFSIPDDAIMMGVEIHIERQGTVTSGNPYTMISCGSIVSGGEAGGDWPVADEVLTLGGPSNAIGELTPAYVNSSSFGVKIWVNTDSSWFSYSGTGTYEVDNVSVTVFYIPAEAIDELPAASPWALAVLAGALSLAALTLHARRRIRS